MLGWTRLTTAVTEQDYGLVRCTEADQIVWNQPVYLQTKQRPRISWRYLAGYNFFYVLEIAKEL